MANYLIITGGSHGIGEKTIAQFMRDGWRAINISRSNCPLPDVNNINIDLADTHWPSKFTDKLQSEVKNADKICLVHSAATFKSDNMATLSEDDFRSVLNVNLVAPMTLNKIFLPYMKTGSSIIYIGSTLSEQAVPNRASYVISKHAVIGMMRSTCQDLAGEEIHTACICPGFVNTKMLTDNVDMSHFSDFIKSKVIAKRLIEPEEIAEFIHFCAMHPIVNGSILHANLGQVTS